MKPKPKFNFKLHLNLNTTQAALYHPELAHGVDLPRHCCLKAFPEGGLCDGHHLGSSFTHDIVFVLNSCRKRLFCFGCTAPNIFCSFIFNIEPVLCRKEIGQNFILPSSKLLAHDFCYNQLSKQWKPSLHIEFGLPLVTGKCVAPPWSRTLN